MRLPPPALLLTLLSLLAACAPSTPDTPELLPTRADTPTPSITPFAIPAEEYYEEGVARQQRGEPEEAEQSLTWAIERDPTFAPAYVARGAVRLAQGDPISALEDADAALAIEPSGKAYALRGEALRLMGRPGLATEAFEQALELTPGLSSETFRSRWLAARASHQGVSLVLLSGEYAKVHPTDPLRHYYRAWASIELGSPSAAVDRLVQAIEETPDPPALLWFTLGRAYLEMNAWQEAITSLEATRTIVQAGDNSLAVHSDRPVADLFGTLGQAYLGAQRCVDAESMIEYALSIGASLSAYRPALEQARICQTPTPTFTPYFATETPLGG